MNTGLLIVISFFIGLITAAVCFGVLALFDEVLNWHWRQNVLVSVAIFFLTCITTLFNGKKLFKVEN